VRHDPCAEVRGVSEGIALAVVVQRQHVAEACPRCCWLCRGTRGAGLGTRQLQPAWRAARAGRLAAAPPRTRHLHPPVERQWRATPATARWRRWLQKRHSAGNKLLIA
jgi:hypothetical protein